MKKVAAYLFLALTSQLLPGATGYFQHNLVSDQPGMADFTDPNAVNVWGVVASATSPFWVCDGGMGLSTIYTVNNTGTAPFGTINTTTKPNVPGAAGAKNGVCTGIVANTASPNFRIGQSQ